MPGYHQIAIIYQFLKIGKIIYATRNKYISWAWTCGAMFVLKEIYGIIAINISTFHLLGQFYNAFSKLRS